MNAPRGAPENPRIYHITHVDNLVSICREGRLWCDSHRTLNGLQSTNIGYSHIKQRRMRRRVMKAAGGCVGDYVPFYFCNRSIMLYVISCGHDDYKGGQSKIVHLVSSVEKAVATGRPWTFTNGHAELAYTSFFDDLADLDKVDWTVMDVRRWGGDEVVKNRRQAEFLVHEWFPWSAVEQIGVINDHMRQTTLEIIKEFAYVPPVTTEPQWYY